MNLTLNNDRQAVHTALDQIITLHGWRRVLGALALRLLRSPRERRLRVELSDHLCRDIGLSPSAKDPPRLPMHLMR